MPSTSEETHFWTLGFEYYVAARSAALSFLIHVCGNLFHHAIEMLLKGRLSQKYSLDELRKFGHDLPKLWNAFKAELSSEDLARFDDAVSALDRFERIRYPDRILAEGAQITLGPGPAESNMPQPMYHVDPSELDRLVAVIFEVCFMNPKFFSEHLPGDYAREAIMRDNPCADTWS